MHAQFKWADLEYERTLEKLDNDIKSLKDTKDSESVSLEEETELLMLEDDKAVFEKVEAMLRRQRRQEARARYARHYPDVDEATDRRLFDDLRAFGCGS